MQTLGKPRPLLLWWHSEELACKLANWARKAIPKQMVYKHRFWLHSTKRWEEERGLSSLSLGFAPSGWKAGSSVLEQIGAGLSGAVVLNFLKERRHSYDFGNEFSLPPMAGTPLFQHLVPCAPFGRRDWDDEFLGIPSDWKTVALWMMCIL